MQTEILFYTRKTTRILDAQGIPIPLQLIHHEELLQQIFYQNRNIPDREQLPERMLNDLRHEIFQQQSIFEGNRPTQRMLIAGRVKDRLNSARVEILDQMLQPRLSNPHDQRPDNFLLWISDHLTIRQVGDGDRG